MSQRYPSQPRSGEAARAERVRDVFHAALETPQTERERFLDEVCEGDAPLRREVASLLAGHLTERLDQLVPAALRGAQDLRGSVREIEIEQPASGRVDDFRIIEPLGRGGSSIVYRAQLDTDDFQQEVAIKILETQSTSPEATRRFGHERSIAARLDHPNIVRLMTGGTTADGRPYYAMEIVDGSSIVEYADENALSLSRRIELVVQVTDAVHYAHQNLLVHRDLKPSNILVDRHGRVRLLDFGIAKSIDADAGPELRTQTGHSLLTLHYCSPEQFRGAQSSTSIDQYQIGLLLFELLTGRRHHTLDGDDQASIARRILERSTPAPSSLTTEGVSNDDSTLHDRAQRWLRELHASPPHLRADLDTVTQRALAKSPDNRYPSVAAMALDLCRILDGDPITARPPSTLERGRRLLRRHPIASTAVVVAALTLVVATIVTSWLALRATRAESNARAEALAADTTTDFLVELFSDSDPGNTGGEDLTATQLLARGLERLDETPVSEPRHQRRLLQTVGEIHSRLGEFETAESLFRRALDAGPDEAPNVEEAILHERLGDTFVRMERWDEADQSYAESLRIRELVSGRSSLEVASSLTGQGRLAADRGRYDEAIALHRRALEIRSSQLPDVSREVALSSYYLGGSLIEAGELDEGIRFLERAVELDTEIHGRESFDVAEDLVVLADAYWRDGRHHSSIASSRESLQISEQLYGPEHHQTLRALLVLALALIERDESEDAEPLILRVIDGRSKIFGPRSSATANGLHNLGYLYQEAGRWLDAEATYVRAIDIRAEVLGTKHPFVAELHENLGEVYVELDRLDEAEASFRAALDIKTQALAAENPRQSWPHYGLGLVAWKRGELALAEQSLEEARRILEDAWGADHGDLAFSLHVLANVHRDADRFDESEVLYRQVLELRRDMPRTKLRWQRTVSDFSQLLAATGRSDELERILSEAAPEA